MLKIPNQPAKLGPSLNVRTEKHGDDNVTAVDIRLKDVALTRAEFNTLLGDAHAFNRYFVDEKGFYKPADPQLKPRALEDSYEGATVVMVLGMNDMGPKVELGDVKIKSITFEPIAGGVVNLSFMLQVVPTERQIGQLGNHVSREISIAVSGATLIEPDGEDQEELPLQDRDAASEPAPPAASRSRSKRKNSSRAPVH